MRLSALYHFLQMPCVFRDPTEFKRTASHISWLPTDGSRLAASYCVLQFQQMPEAMSLDSYIWDVNNPNFPQMTITPPSPLVCLEYSTKDPHFLVGGSYNGLICCVRDTILRLALLE